MDKLGYFKSILLGIAEGLTGLMPLSSSGHLLVIEKTSGIGLSSQELIPFLTFLRLGALLAILISCVKPLIEMLAHPIKSELKWTVLSALPLLVLTLIIKHGKWENVLKGSAAMLLPFAFLFTAVVLFLSNGIAKNRKIAKTSHDAPKLTDALLAGLMECLSAFTGVSLTAMSVSGSLVGGLKSKKAAEFAYLSLVPACLVLCLGDAAESISSGQMKQALNQSGYILLAGLIAAMISGVFAVKLTQWLIKKEKIGWFSLYLVLAAAGVLALRISGTL